MKLKLKAEENGQTEEVASIEVRDGKAVVWVGGNKYEFEINEGKGEFISLVTLEVNQL
jgi:ssDNA-binding replication factor A large subunit